MDVLTRRGHPARHAREPDPLPPVLSLVVVEDDPKICSLVLRAMSARGHAVACHTSGLEGLQAVIDTGPDVVLLDLGLPDVAGLDLLAMLRAVTDVPVIVITAADGDLVRALDGGADDYVVKPFGMDHLDARVRAVVRRSTPGRHHAPLVVGDLAVDPASRTARLDGRLLALTRREFDLLLTLAGRAGAVVSKRTLLAEVWKQPYGGDDRTVDVHVSSLRRKLGETAAEPRYLVSVRGVGLRLAAPDASEAADAPDAPGSACSAEPPDALA